MPIAARPHEHIVNQTYPDFLRLLDSDQEVGRDGFCTFALKLLRSSPTRCMRWLDENDREEVISRVVYYCLADDCRPLRQYVDKGNAFRTWLFGVAESRCIDLWRERKRKPEWSIDEHDRWEAPAVPLDPGGDVDASPVVQLVRSHIMQMNRKCQVLLLCSGDGWSGAQLAVLAGFGPGEKLNVKASNDLRYCRNELKKRLAKAGIAHRDLID